MFVLCMREEYSNKKTAFRKVIDAHKVELDKKEKYWNEMLQVHETVDVHLNNNLYWTERWVMYLIALNSLLIDFLGIIEILCIFEKSFYETTMSCLESTDDVIFLFCTVKSFVF